MKINVGGGRDFSSCAHLSQRGVTIFIRECQGLICRAATRRRRLLRGVARRKAWGERREERRTRR